MIRTKASTKALYGVIAGGGRRTNKVVVSMLYPLFMEESLSLSSIALNDGRVSDDRIIENLSFGSAILIGGTVEGLPVKEYNLSNEDLNFSSIILFGGSVEVADISVDYDLGAEDLIFSASILAGGKIKTVAIRYNMADFDSSELNFSSSILTGGTVG